MATTYNLTLLPGAAYTTAQTGADNGNPGCRGVVVVVDITVVPGSAPSNTVTIQGKDVASGKYYTLLASAALTGTGTTRYTVYPGLTAASNVTATDVLPAVWRVIVAVGNANSATYSIGASLIP